MVVQANLQADPIPLERALLLARRRTRARLVLPHQTDRRLRVGMREHRAPRNRPVEASQVLGALRQDLIVGAQRRRRRQPVDRLARQAPDLDALDRKQAVGDVEQPDRLDLTAFQRRRHLVRVIRLRGAIVLETHVTLRIDAVRLQCRLGELFMIHREQAERRPFQLLDGAHRAILRHHERAVLVPRVRAEDAHVAALVSRQERENRVDERGVAFAIEQPAIGIAGDAHVAHLDVESLVAVKTELFHNHHRSKACGQIRQRRQQSQGLEAGRHMRLHRTGFAARILLIDRHRSVRM